MGHCCLWCRGASTARKTQGVGVLCSPVAATLRVTEEGSSRPLGEVPHLAGAGAHLAWGLTSTSCLLASTRIGTPSSASLMTIFSGVGREAAVSALHPPPHRSPHPCRPHMDALGWHPPVLEWPNLLPAQLWNAGCADRTLPLPASPAWLAVPTKRLFGLRQPLLVRGVDDIDDAMTLCIVLGRSKTRC